MMQIDIVSILFRLINFAIVIGLMVFIFKRYLFKTIRAQIQAKKGLIQGLITTERMLIRKRNAISRTLKEDQQIETRLKEQLMRWRAVIDKEKKELYDVRNARIAVLENRLKKHEVEIQARIVAHQLMPTIIVETKNILMKDLSTEKEQIAYMQKLMAYMQGDKE